MTRKNLLERLREIKIIDKREIKLRSGAVSSFYCDIKKVYGYPEVMNALVDLIKNKISKNITCIAASGYGGIPLASVISSRLNKKLILVREKPKKHGRGGYIDGYIPNKKDKIAIVDDVITSGSSIRSTIRTLKKMKVKTSYAIVVVERRKVKLPIPYYFIFNVEEFY